MDACLLMGSRKLHRRGAEGAEKKREEDGYKHTCRRRNKKTHRRGVEDAGKKGNKQAFFACLLRHAKNAKKQTPPFSPRLRGEKGGRGDERGAFPGPGAHAGAKGAHAGAPLQGKTFPGVLLFDQSK